MSRKTIEMAREIAAQYSKAERFQTWTHDFMMQRLMELVTVSATIEREACAQIAETAEPYQAADLIRARSNT